MTEAEKDQTGSAAKPKPAADEIERFTLADIQERAATVYGADPHTIAGALSGDRRRKTWTEDEVKAAIKDFRDPRKTPGHVEPEGDE